jgi:hypothetical protein
VQVRLLALALTFAAIAITFVTARAAVTAAAERRDALTVRTSLGPIDAGDTRNPRDLHARGSAPAGSRLLVRFFRGERRVGLARPEVKSGRYAAATEINRTGEYFVRVTATTLGGRRLRVSAKLNYGPRAEAPSAP